MSRNSPIMHLKTLIFPQGKDLKGHVLLGAKVKTYISRTARVNSYRTVIVTMMDAIVNASWVVDTLLPSYNFQWLLH